MNVKLALALKRNPITRNVYNKLKSVKDKRLENKQFRYTGYFDDRSCGSEVLCIILAGYKEYLYEDVFERIVKFSSPNIDICIVSSGKNSSELRERCKKNNWSYLSTRENNVSLVQNVAIMLHPNAKMIFKLDEDIFITENYFSNMLRAFQHCKNSFYNPGFLAPIININGYSHYLILEKLKLIDDYKRRFEKPIIMAGNNRMIQSNPEVARYFWGEGDIVPPIDILNRMFAEDQVSENLCPIRFSIGAILFERDFWKQMGYFKVDLNGNAMGMDETQICEYCMRVSRPIVVSNNVVVGHFSFGPQNEAMISFYKNNSERFKIID